MAKSDKAEASAAPVVFKDKAFKSRTIVLDDGRSFVVEKSTIEATDAALIVHLDSHPDFERV
ncbi:MAG: hypothetical protein HRU77_04115 [Gammaproteobacteria bacterium]|nr:MAG: hypothetical protein HRU77_04115 [Gammaproteobacteria bacterium]